MSGVYSVKLYRPPLCEQCGVNTPILRLECTWHEGKSGKGEEARNVCQECGQKLVAAWRENRYIGFFDEGLSFYYWCVQHTKRVAANTDSYY
mgnify:CR=1 FL=1